MKENIQKAKILYLLYLTTTLLVSVGLITTHSSFANAQQQNNTLMQAQGKQGMATNATITLCPTNDCKQEFIGVFYDTGQLSPSVQGTLKIENKITSTPDIIKYSLISFASNFHVTGIEENRKTGHNVIVFGGDLNLGDGTSTMDAAMNPEFKYNVTGTFDNATKVLAFKGERSSS